MTKNPGSDDRHPGVGQTALITGATSGIGLHLAHEFALHGHPLVLVAPVDDELTRVASDIRSRFGVAVVTIACDLEQPEAVDTIRRALGAAPVDILVNNAGHGQRGRFWEIPLERHLSVLRLNVDAVLRLTHAFLPAMLARGSGRILNIASVAGFEPGPMLAVYHATKAAVLSWSEALATELADTGVTVTTVCPGPTDTDFFAKAGMENTRAFQQANLMAPQDVAKPAYEATMDGERLLIPGGMNKGMVFARRLLPETAQAAFNEKLYEEVAPEDRKRVRGEKEAAAKSRQQH
jgi:short-subunit dehydrogenase